jgi:hypothetical protein
MLTLQNLRRTVPVVAAESTGTPRTFRLPRLAYLVVLMLVLGATVLVQHPIASVAYAIPLVAAVFIARTATVVDASGITVRALIGQRRLPWNDVRGLSVTGRSIYVVTASGSVRLPCVRIADLAALTVASAGHLPPLPEATPKLPPSRRRR